MKISSGMISSKLSSKKHVMALEKAGKRKEKFAESKLFSK
jgi:hypothetical protein